jgi:hypothetical protein
VLAKLGIQPGRIAHDDPPSFVDCLGRRSSR